MVTKSPHNAAWGVVRATAKPNQRNTVVFEDTIDPTCNAPPFRHPLDTQGGKTLQELCELSGVHLFVFKLVVMIMLWFILTRRDRGRLKQSKPLI